MPPDREEHEYRPRLHLTQIKIYAILIGAAILMAVIGVIVGFVLGKMSEKKKPPTVNTTIVQQKLSLCSELTTSRMDYHGVVHFQDGEIPWITQKSFLMEYDAYVEAGIDLSKAVVTVEDNVVYVHLPEPEIQTVKVDPNSLVFENETFSLFNWKKHEDVSEALEFAEEDLLEKAEESRLLQEARTQAEEVITTMLHPILMDENNEYQYEVVVD